MKTNSDIRNMLKDAGILFAITLIAGLVLGYVYELTKEPIRLQQERAIQEACKKVFTAAEQFVPTEYVPSEGLLSELSGAGVTPGTVYQALSADGELLGYVVESTSGEGYGGDITLYAGVMTDGTLNGISILEIAETPGLGMRAEEDLVPQFEKKSAASFTYTKSGSTMDSEIDAISGATVTTKAVTDAVNGALKVCEELRAGGGQNE